MQIHSIFRYFRGPTTHRMPTWVRLVFLYYLPMMLLMKRPERQLAHGLFDFSWQKFIKFQMAQAPTKIPTGIRQIIMEQQVREGGIMLNPKFWIFYNFQTSPEHWTSRRRRSSRQFTPNCTRTPSALQTVRRCQSNRENRFRGSWKYGWLNANFDWFIDWSLRTPSTLNSPLIHTEL